jgi:hypothetical protein
MMLERSAPSLEYPEEPGLIPSYECGILNQFFQGLEGSEKQGSLGDPLIESHEPANLLGHRKGDHEVMSRHLPIQLFRKPLPGLVVLTGRTMAVAAGTMDCVVFPAFLTPEQGCSTRRSTAVDDGGNRSMVFTRYSTAKA